MKLTTIITGCTLAAALSTPAFAGKDVTIDEVPDKVQSTIKREVADGFLEDIERETLEGRTVYEVELVQADGKEMELVIAEDGTVVRRDPD